MATKTKSSTDDTSAEPSSTRPRWPSRTRMIQNFLLVWLDENINGDHNGDCSDSIKQLREVVNTVKTFTDVDECIRFINDIDREKVFIILSGFLDQTMVPIVHDKTQVNMIYILCDNTTRHEKWTQKWSKIKGVFTDITSICETLKQTTQHCNQNSVPISLVKKTDGTVNQNLNELDQSFMYTQILKEILLTIDFGQVHIDEFLADCREQFAGNTIQFDHIEKFSKEYRHHDPIWWYTYDSFLYSTLNCALRTMEIDLIIKMGFFVRDLHNQLAALHSEQYSSENHSNSFIVYRGQGISQSDFEEVKKTEGGLLAFNNFLSTSANQEVSLAFAESNLSNPDVIGVLFKITTNPSIPSSPFASIENVSYYAKEQETLFSMHSVSRIGEIKQIDGNDRLWQVNLSVTSDNDPQLQILTERMREETKGSTGWLRLGKLIVKLAQYDEAEHLHELLLVQTTDEKEKGDILYQLGCIQVHQGKFDKALTFFDDSLHLREKTLTSHHPDVADCYNDIGTLYASMGKNSEALLSLEQAQQIYQKTLSANHPDLATSYGNIGSVYNSMGEYSKALSHYEKALEIYQEALPANHPDLATSYGNIGSVYNSMGEYSKALSSHEKALEIREKTLPANHPSLATSYNNIGCVYNRMGEYSKALSSHQKAVEINQETLPANHPSLATSYNNIGSVYNSMGEYSKALSSHQKALKINQETLPANHPSLATSYNNIANVYNSMGEYSKALSSHRKALEIYQKTLPANHPDLATSYGNIANVYNSMGEYSKALSHYEKALEIYQKTLSANHPDLATSYGNIGNVYNSMGEYSKALSSHEKALEIREKTLPANHPSLATSYNNMGSVYNSMGEYSKALSHYEKALEIYQEALPANHPSLATPYSNIAKVYECLAEYSRAHLYCEYAFDISKRLLPPDDPQVGTVNQIIEFVKMEL